MSEDAATLGVASLAGDAANFILRLISVLFGSAALEPHVSLQLPAPMVGREFNLKQTHHGRVHKHYAASGGGTRRRLSIVPR